MPSAFFVYGTLRSDLRERSAARYPELQIVGARLRSRGPATIRGYLYDLGDFPGLVLDEASDIVVGEVVEVPDDVVPFLDEFEDARPDDLAVGLFRRELHDVRSAGGGSFRCWVYVYNQSIVGRQRLALGDWAAVEARRAPMGRERTCSPPNVSTAEG